MLVPVLVPDFLFSITRTAGRTISKNKKPPLTRRRGGKALVLFSFFPGQ
jgi:hypothetical protein